ncbi:hypothetical protein RI367_005809 [Sorochytrium milnesiophthora]
MTNARQAMRPPRSTATDEQAIDGSKVGVLAAAAAAVAATSKLPEQFINANTRVLDTRTLTSVNHDTLAAITQAADNLLTLSASPTVDATQLKSIVDTVNYAMHLNLLAGNHAATETLFARLSSTSAVSPSVVSYNHMLQAYMLGGQVDKALQLFKTMRKQHTANAISLCNVVHGLVSHRRVDEAFELVERWEDASAKLTQPVVTSLIKGCLDTNQVERAWKTFYDMQFKHFPPDEVTYSLMMKACAQTDDAEKALNLFDDMRNRNLYPTTTTFNTLLYALSRRADYAPEAMRLYRQMVQSTSVSIHGVEKTFTPDTYTFGYLMAAARKLSNWHMGMAVWDEAVQHASVDVKLVEVALWTLANAGRSWQPRKSTRSTDSGSMVHLDPALPPALAPVEDNTAYLRATSDQLFAYAQRLAPEGNQAAFNAYLATHFPHHATRGYRLYQEALSNGQVNGVTHLLALAHCMSSTSQEWRMKGVAAFEAWEIGLRAVSATAASHDLRHCGFFPAKSVALLRRQCQEHHLTLERRDFGELLRYTRYSPDAELARKSRKLLEPHFSKETELEKQLKNLRKKWQ